MEKCTDPKTLIRLLRAKGFEFVRKGKHAIYSNGTLSLAVPTKKQGFSIMVARRLLKEAGYETV